MSKKPSIEEMINIAAADSNFCVFDYPFVEPQMYSDEEKKENDAAIEKLGKEFTFLRRDVPPKCGQLTLPINEAELEWVASSIREHGWKVLTNYIVAPDETIKAMIAQLCQGDSKDIHLIDELKKVNEKSKQTRQEKTSA